MFGGNKKRSTQAGDYSECMLSRKSGSIVNCAKTGRFQTDRSFSG